MSMQTRRYQRTHSWLTFQVRLDQASNHRLWIALGEAQSKCEHLAWVPLLPAISEHMHQILLAKGVLATTAIEGNTLSEEQVLQHLEGKLKLPQSQEYMAQEIANIVAAVNQIGQAILAGGSDDLSIEKLKRYNATVLDKLELGEGVIPGEIRRHEVSVGRYPGAPAEDCQYLLERLCDWLNQPEFRPTDDDAIIMGLVRAVLAHLYLAWIHPFGDGNGRTARLVEFELLVAAGVPSAAAHLLSNHYNQTRQEYYRQLDRASRSADGVLSFVEYAIRGFVDGVREQIEWVKVQQMHITWHHYVSSVIGKRAAKVTGQRRMTLALELAGSSEPVPLSKIPDLTTELAREYAKKTPKTVSRDVNALIAMELAVKESGGYRANWKLLDAFRPARRTLGPRALPLL